VIHQGKGVIDRQEAQVRLAQLLERCLSSIPAQRAGWEHLAKAALGVPSCSVQEQAGCGSGQPGLLVGDPAHSRGLELDEHCGPFQPRLFYESMIL